MTETIKDDLRHIKIVDSREPAEIRTKLLELGWRQQRLQSGDFMFWTCQYQMLGITRKTTQDFMNSINDKFSQQLEVMLETYNICVMLVENPWQWVKGTGQLYTTYRLEKHIKKEILNFIHRWEAKGFILERTIDWKDTCDRLNELYALYQRPYSLSARSKGYSDERLLALPSGVRGKTGEKVLETLGSLQSIANAPKEQLLTIDGIGNKKVELIYNHFRRNVNRDLTNLP